MLSRFELRFRPSAIYAILILRLIRGGGGENEYYYLYLRM